MKGSTLPLLIDDLEVESRRRNLTDLNGAALVDMTAYAEVNNYRKSGDVFSNGLRTA